VAHLYYVDPDVHLSTGTTVSLTGDEARHAASVSRVRVGEQVKLSDGRGTLAEAHITAIAKNDVTLRVLSVADVEKQCPQLVLVQALAKADRDERAIEAATEIGVDTVIPWQAERSVSRWDDVKRAKGQQRWESIVREASKQSIRAWRPDVAAMITSTDLPAGTKTSVVLALDPRGKESLSSLSLDHAERISVIVGPEGGMSEGEIERLQQAGAHVVSMGELVLRTSTAGPAALAVLQARLGRW